MRKFIILVLFAFVFDAEGAEPHLRNIRQLTFGGENAEAYFSADGKELIFQSTHPPYSCDQIFTMKTDGSGVHLVSTGKGRTTCAYFYPDHKKILFSSTHETVATCPQTPDRSKGYVWGLYPYDIYLSNPDGSNLRVLSHSAGYDAEATISPDGKKIVFTSDRDGDLELYTMDTDGKNVRRLTNSSGYDGGAFFSPDSRKIVYRAHHITDPKELEEYHALLKQHLVKPLKLELYVMNADGSNVVQITHNNAANFCPYFHPDGKRLIFASNVNDPAQRDFDLYMIGVDGNGLEQITSNPTFDGFPMFSPDGKQLVFASNRDAKVPGDTNIFIADWVEEASKISESDLRKDIGFLASDDLKGRLTGTPEARKAAEYIASEFSRFGLEHPPGLNSSFQKFEFTSGVKLGAPNSLAVARKNLKTSYKPEKDFTPTGFASDASLTQIPVAFAGYGIRAGDLKYDDYANLDVKGKAVVCYRFGPEGDDPKSEYAQYYPVRYKAMTAREAGAVALFVVSDNPEDDDLLKLHADTMFGNAGIPVISVKRSVVKQWLKAANLSFPDRKNPHEAPFDFQIPDLTISMECHLIREKSSSDNVLGWLPAAKKTEETIVIGAHYDHLGLGIEGSLAEKPGEIHNGADDNASGVAGMLEMARLFSSNRDTLKRNLLFIGFGGEELGVLGSSYFVKNPIFPLRNMIAMLNMDMIGRLRKDKLVVGGTGTSPAWKDLLNSANRDGLKLTMNEDGYGPSDHSMFYAKNIPVLFFFTGAHPQYHRPDDDAGLIEYHGMTQVLDFIYRVTNGILDMPHAPQFVQVKSSVQEGASRGFRVYLGTIPDYTEEVKGVKLTGVRKDSPAEKAGIQGGDVIIEFGGKKIENIYDYTFALQEHKAGDVVTIVVLRDGKEVPLKVTLEKRSQ